MLHFQTCSKAVQSAPKTHRRRKARGSNVESSTSYDVLNSICVLKSKKDIRQIKSTKDGEDPVSAVCSTLIMKHLA